ncbi:hypothetical protein BDV95DRAFT_598209 [Massariosphaeria phaeospora]|uniref:Enoyl reductase (ER) domain-containing protein n=1 Tax=Massariosphaeria phaeospora TaxID=100035 RepID=A0A7C8MDX6_9PLEO|nr:hypothetical protein BDV95DRAFT_598209 [Massariosphaeria phaeospora]
MTSPPTVPPTMKAWTFSRPGAHRQVLRLNDIPSPKNPIEAQVLIKVAYASLDGGAMKLMAMVPSLLRPKDSIPGSDFSGTIVSLGPSAPSHLHVGMAVFGLLGISATLKGSGTLREYVCVSAAETLIVPVPEGFSLEEAGSLGTATEMAYLICKHGQIQQDCGYRILVNGSSGGCGSMFVQTAVAMGAKEVVGTCSAPNSDFVKQLGATRTIDYRSNAPLHAYLAKEYSDQKFDFILDTVGSQELYNNSPGYLKEGGTFLNIGDFTSGTLLTLIHWILNTYWPKWLGGTPRKYIMFSGKAEPTSSDWIFKLLQEGNAKATVEKAFNFDQALEALDMIATKRVRGRVVIKVAE